MTLKVGSLVPGQFQSGELTK